MDKNNNENPYWKHLAGVVKSWRSIALFLVCTTPLLAQFTLTTVSPAAPNNTIPVKLSGTAHGKSSGNFTFGGSTHAMSYDSQTKLLEMDLDQPNISAVNLSLENALATDGTRYAGWDTFQSTYPLALGTHNRCVVWTEDAAVPKQSFHPADFGDSWCTGIDKGVPVGTAYLQFIESVCTQDLGCRNIVRTYQSAILNGAPIVTSDSFCFTPVSFDNGGTCFSRARGISADDVVGDYNGSVGSPFDPATAGKSVGSALDSSPEANPLPHALVWHPSKQSVVELHPAGFTASIALATNGLQQGGWATDLSGAMHAILWSGTAASAVDLSPAGYTDTRISGLSTNFQVGDGWAGGAANSPGAVKHGLLWQGSAAGVLDLNQFLPPGYTHLTITGVDADGSISGYMQQDFNGTPAANSEVGVLLIPTPSISISSLVLSSVNPAPGDTVTGTVSLGSAAPLGGVPVTISSSNAALVPAPLPIVIPAGQSSISFTVPVSAAAFAPVPAPVTLTARTGLISRSATMTVTPQPPADAIVSISFSSQSLAPGDSVAVNVALAAPAPAGGALVSFSSSNTAVLPTPATIQISAGQSAATFTIASNPAPLFQPVTVILSAATGNAVQQASLTVASVPKPNGVFLGTVQNATFSTAGGTSGSGFVALSAAATIPATVTLTNTNPALKVPASISVAPGQFDANFTYTALPVPVATTGTLTATINGFSTSSTITVNASPSPAIQSLSIPLVSATQTWSSGQTLTGTVTLSGPAFLGGMTVALATDTPAVVSLPANITIPAGTTTASFAVQAGQVTAPTAATITAALPGFAPVAVTLTIIPGPALAITSYTLNPYSMIGPGVVTSGTIRLNQPAPSGGVVLALSAAPGSAKVSSSATVAAGQTSAVVSIQGNSVSGPATVVLTASYQGVLAPLGTLATASLVVAPTDTLKMPKPTWSSSTHALTVTATSTNPLSMITVLNANGNVPLGTMTGDGAGNYTFQTTIASIASVNIKSNLGGSTGQGVTLVP